MTRKVYVQAGEKKAEAPKKDSKRKESAPEHFECVFVGSVAIVQIVQIV